MTASWTWWLCFRADGFQSAQGSVEHSVFSTRSLTVDVVIQTAILSYVLVFVDYRTPVPLHQTLWSIRFVSRDSKLCDVSDVGLATPNLTSGPGAEWIFKGPPGLLSPPTHSSQRTRVREKHRSGRKDGKKGAPEEDKSQTAGWRLVWHERQNYLSQRWRHLQCRRHGAALRQGAASLRGVKGQAPSLKMRSSSPRHSLRAPSGVFW